MLVSRCGTWSRSSSMPEPPFDAISDGRRGEARRAHVLDGDDRVGRHQLEAGFEQQLFGERIADLHRRALLFRILVELGRRHGRAVDAVAPGLGADIDDGIAGALGGRQEDLVRAREADAHRVDQNVAVVGGGGNSLRRRPSARPCNCRSRRCRRRRRRRDAASSDDAASPKRSAFIIAIGRAPMVKTSRMMPPTPVAAP